jgi:serine/threonine protein phosphatase PrpC
MADRPITSSGGAQLEPEKTHRRKFSLERVKALPVVAKFSHRSCTGHIPGNPNKVNQDSFIECMHFAMNPDLYLFGVCDGHGFYGREVSQMVKQRYPALLGQEPNLLANPKKAITASTLRCNNELQHANFDVNFSGTTMVTVLIRGSKLWCANVGDSRALMARQLGDSFLAQEQLSPKQSGKHWMSIALSRDHKPDEKDESARILHCGGRIEAYQGTFYLR